MGTPVIVDAVIIFSTKKDLEKEKKTWREKISNESAFFTKISVKKERYEWDGKSQSYMS